MIEPKEIRIGNFVHWLNDSYEVAIPRPGLFKVVSIGLFDCNILRQNKVLALIHVWRTVNPGDLDPIPLTEKWLDKFAEYKSEQWSIVEGLYSVRKTEDGEFYFAVEYTEGDGGLIYLSQVKYVHQLQNLYFFITGEELTIIKPDTE